MGLGEATCVYAVFMPTSSRPTEISFGGTPAFQSAAWWGPRPNLGGEVWVISGAFRPAAGRFSGSAVFLDEEGDFHRRAVLRDGPVFNPSRLPHQLQSRDSLDGLLGFFGRVVSGILPAFFC